MEIGDKSSVLAIPFRDKKMQHEFIIFQLCETFLFQFRQENIIKITIYIIIIV